MAFNKNKPAQSPSLVAFAETSASREIFDELYNRNPNSEAIRNSKYYLEELLSATTNAFTGLPTEPEDLPEWMMDQVRVVGDKYKDYLQSRDEGKGRHYFKNKAHALHFIRSVAPTKLVDGSWLFGLISRWKDPRFGHLIETYLEELGDGSPTKNHVAIYKKLLLSQGCESWRNLSDPHYTQGAIQLSMAYNAKSFLPEIIGYNLGYEQLPLHLLITAYELKELRIDPYYFTLHITVDNADTGHARKAVDAVFETMPQVGDPEEWYRRVRNGFALNSIGASTLSVIEEFEIEPEVEQVLRNKCQVGRCVHGESHLIGNRSMNSWLSNPDSMRELMDVMVAEGWIIRNQDPLKSRFWTLIQSSRARMYGAFSAFEQQVIYDWIAGDFKGAQPNIKRQLDSEPALDPDILQRMRHGEPDLGQNDDTGDFGCEVNELNQKLRHLSEQEAMDSIIRLMSPALHHTASGLKATRLFIEIYR